MFNMEDLSIKTQEFFLSYSYTASNNFKDKI